MAEDKILIVDDDKTILKSFERRFAKKLAVSTALGVKEGLECVNLDGPFAVVVSDYRMPVMNGVDFLARVKQVSPDTVRILLTGFADLKTAIEAVNKGNIFRLLTKPCPSEVMIPALAEAIRQYRLVNSERILLENTLRGAVHLMSELLALGKPEAFGRTLRIENLAGKVARAMNASPLWEIEVAASLSQIGLLAFPDHLVKRISLGKPLTENESKLFENHPKTAAELIANIPRLQQVADTVYYQEKCFDGNGLPRDPVKGDKIPLGARILKVVLDCDVYLQTGASMKEAIKELETVKDQYDPEVLNALSAVLAEESKYEVREVSIVALKRGMILAQDLYAIDPAKVMLSKGNELTPSIIQHILRLKSTVGIREPIKVVEPVDVNSTQNKYTEHGQSGACRKNEPAREVGDK